MILTASVALAAGGTAIAPHDHPARPISPTSDHPPTALRLALLAHLEHLPALDVERYLSAVDPEPPSFVSAPALPATAAAVVLALLAFPARRPWRPSPAAIVFVKALVRDAQRSSRAPRHPPRPSFVAA